MLVQLSERVKANAVLSRQEGAYKATIPEEIDRFKLDSLRDTLRRVGYARDLHRAGKRYFVSAPIISVDFDYLFVGERT